MDAGKASSGAPYLRVSRRATLAPDISELDMDHIDTYIRPKTDRKARWEDLPQNIRDTFDRLGIPEAEKKSLAGVGAQYDSEVVYHNVQKELKEQGVIYVDFETAVKEYEDLIRPYFGQLITPNYHKFAALHYAVWSGGSFCLCAKRRPCAYAAAELFPFECARRRPV